jgi:hypothetical protein
MTRSSCCGVTPAKAGVQEAKDRMVALDARLRGHDERAQEKLSP